MERQCNGSQLGRVRMRLRRCAARPGSSRPSARTSSESRFEGLREARDGTDRDDGGPCAVPTPFLLVLIFWLAIIFISFGLFAPANTTVIVTMFVCALSISGAIFLILELDGVLLGRVPPCSARRRTGTSRG